jgi:hypothetical protein
MLNATESVPSLNSVLSDASEHDLIRHAAVTALASIGTVGARQILMKQLEQTHSEDLRKAISDALLGFVTRDAGDL